MPKFARNLYDSIHKSTAMMVMSTSLEAQYWVNSSIQLLTVMTSAMANENNPEMK